MLVCRVTPEGVAQIYHGSSEHKSSNLEIPHMCPDARVCVGSRCSQSDNQKDLLLMKIAISLVNNEQSWHREDDI